MIDEAMLEHRLTALENTVADVKRRLNQRSGGSGNWIQEIAGSISDDEAFGEALAYGQDIRHADHPQNDQSPSE